MKKRRPWRVSFDTPEELYDRMLEYLDDVIIKNANRLAYIDMSSGEEYDTLELALQAGLDEDDVKATVIRTPLEERVRPTMYGFCAFCNLGSKTLWYYSNRGEEFAEVVAWFKNILQADLEQILINPTTRNTNGPKFVAVNNFGWHDKSEVNHVGAQPVTFVNDLKDIPDVD